MTNEQEPQLDSRTLPELIESVDIGGEAGESEPGSHALVRLTDLLPRKRKNVDEKSKYSSEFNSRLQRPAQQAIERVPEYVGAVRAAFAATYHIKDTQPELQQDIVEEAVAEALRLHVACVCGNIEVTCPRCCPRSRGRDRSNKRQRHIPFNVEGLVKHTRRICERLKKQAFRRSLTLQQRGVEEADNEYVRPDWRDASQVEDTLVAAIDQNGRVHAPELGPEPPETESMTKHKRELDAQKTASAEANARRLADYAAGR